MAIEDRRFYVHHGIDFVGVARALVADVLAGHIVQGGSTITEQYVKNAYLSNESGLLRKVHEAVLAWQLEDRWSKDQILTAYLNTVYYGQGAYGVQAAARTFFHKNVWQLSLAQCALLAGLPRDPTGYSPIYDPADAMARRDLVLSEMRAQGYIGASQAAAASRAGTHVFATASPSQKGPAAYFMQYVTEQLIRRFGVAQALQGGLKVYTSLDMRLQGDGIKALKSTLPKGPGRGARRRSTRPTATSAPWWPAPTTGAPSSTWPGRPTASSGLRPARPRRRPGQDRSGGPPHGHHRPRCGRTRRSCSVPRS